MDWEHDVELELKEQFPEQKTKLEEVTSRIWEELYNFHLTGAKFFVASDFDCDKTLREKCLEAVEYFWKTTKEVCREVFPDLIEGSSEWIPAMRRVSMALMRLSRVKPLLVACDSSRKEHAYVASLIGVKKLVSIREGRKKAGRKKVLQGQIEKIVKSNEEWLPLYGSMRECQRKALGRLEHAGLAQPLQAQYSKMFGELATQLVACQRAMVDNDVDDVAKAIAESTEALMNLGRFEAKYTEIWMYQIDEQKRLNILLAKRDKEI